MTLILYKAIIKLHNTLETAHTLKRSDLWCFLSFLTAPGHHLVKRNKSNLCICQISMEEIKPYTDMRVNDDRTSMISIDFVHKAHLTYRYNVTKKLHTKVFFFFALIASCHSDVINYKCHYLKITPRQMGFPAKQLTKITTYAHFTWREC